MFSVKAAPPAPPLLEGTMPPRDSDDAALALRNGPRGALVISAIAVAILFVGWILFYFFLFIPRGPIG